MAAYRLGAKIRFGDGIFHQAVYAFKPSDWHDQGLPNRQDQELKEGVTSQTPRYRSVLDPKYRVTSGDILFRGPPI